MGRAAELWMVAQDRRPGAETHLLKAAGPGSGCCRGRCLAPRKPLRAALHSWGVNPIAGCVFTCKCTALGLDFGVPI